MRVLTPLIAFAKRISLCIAASCIAACSAILPRASSEVSFRTPETVLAEWEAICVSDKPTVAAFAQFRDNHEAAHATIVIVAAAGEQPTGGVTLTVDRVTLDGDRVNIFTTLSKPSRNAIVIQVLTYPCQIITIDLPAARMRQSLHVALYINRRLAAERAITP